jgi:cobalt-zinc-cadmium efflux system protein
MTDLSAQSAAGRHKNRLVVVLFMTAAYLVAEVIGGLLTGSLALLADAGHMLTDVAGIGLALLAIQFGERPATPEHTYGYYRLEILAAVANSVVLIGVSLYILWEAYKRFRQPPEVSSGTMLVVALVGLAVNVVSMLMLRRASGESLNMTGAYYEVLSDLLTSVGVIVAALVMITTGWYYADPIISAAIGLFILPRTWKLLKEGIGVLLEGTPSDVSLAAVRESLKQIPGVLDVHDLHVWSLTSGVNACSAHLTIRDASLQSEVLTRARCVLKEKHKLEHLTLELEPPGLEDCELHE